MLVVSLMLVTFQSKVVLVRLALWDRVVFFRQILVRVILAVAPSPVALAVAPSPVALTFSFIDFISKIK